MKKIRLGLLTAMLLLAACSPNAANNGFKDGVYSGKSDAWLFGSEIATVTINKNKISDIVLRKLDAEGNEIDYNLWTGNEVDGSINPDLKGAREKLALSMIKNQTWDVDTISKCTISSSNWKTAVKRALDTAVGR